MTTATPAPAARRNAAAAPAELVSARQTHFAARHIGPRADDVREMLETLGYDSLDALIDAVVPEDIRLRRPLALPGGQTDIEAADRRPDGSILIFDAGFAHRATFGPERTGEGASAAGA